MGYGDAFLMLTLFYVGLSLLVMLLKKPAARSPRPRIRAFSDEAIHPLVIPRRAVGGCCKTPAMHL